MNTTFFLGILANIDGAFSGDGTFSFSDGYYLTSYCSGTGKGNFDFVDYGLIPFQIR
jgi:hypothetical protein